MDVRYNNTSLLGCYTRYMHKGFIV
uniref:Uncharacterized protein n=1 Tax=Arundo donax TaxID=35708 RepID=A0A0A9BFC8_ARUDO